MPLKEYACGKCGHKFEVLLMLSEPDPQACPKCGATELKRLLSTFRITGARSKSARAEDDLGEAPGAGMDDLGGGMADIGGGDNGMDAGGMGDEAGAGDEPAGDGGGPDAGGFKDES